MDDKHGSCRLGKCVLLVGIYNSSKERHITEARVQVFDSTSEQ